MVQTILLDIPPDPSATGALTAVLVLFLWYRKRSMRGVVMVRHEPLPVPGAGSTQLKNPNQP